MAKRKTPIDFGENPYILEDDPPPLGFTCLGGKVAAIPYGNKQYVIISNGQQIKTCRNRETAIKLLENQK
jgi:hypothetical protein